MLCGISRRLSNRFNFRTAKQFYFSSVYSVVSYCICVYGGVLTSTSRGEQVKNLHNKIVNRIFKKFYPHSTSILKDMNLLSIEDIFKFRASVYMFKFLMQNDRTLSNNINVTYPSHLYSTRSSNMLIPSFPRVAAIRINFEHQFVVIWNSLPANIFPSAPNMDRFKKC